MYLNKIYRKECNVWLIWLICFLFLSRRNISVISLTSWLASISNRMHKSLRALVALSFLCIKIRKIRTFNTISTIPQRPIDRTKTLISLRVVNGLCKTLTTFCTWIKHSWKCATYGYSLYRNRVEYGLLLWLAIFV